MANGNYNATVAIEFMAEFKKLQNDMARVQAQMGKTGTATSKLSKNIQGLSNIIKADIVLRLGKNVLSVGEDIYSTTAKVGGLTDAFNKLGDPLLMAQLKNATQGMVSNQNLMKATNYAKGFNVEINKLPELMAFASKRALELGEDANQLTNDIITGIGRGSIKILDNLGLSVQTLRKYFAETGDWTEATVKTIREQFGDTTEVDEYAAAVEKLRASFNDAGVALKQFVATKIVKPEWLDAMTSLLKQSFGKEDELKNSVGDVISDIRDNIKEAGFTAEDLEKHTLKYYDMVAMIMETISNAENEANQKLGDVRSNDNFWNTGIIGQLFRDDTSDLVEVTTRLNGLKWLTENYELLFKTIEDLKNKDQSSGSVGGSKSGYINWLKTSIKNLNEAIGELDFVNTGKFDEQIKALKTKRDSFQEALDLWLNGASPEIIVEPEIEIDMPDLEFNKQFTQNWWDLWAQAMGDQLQRSLDNNLNVAQMFIEHMTQEQVKIINEMEELRRLINETFEGMFEDALTSALAGFGECLVTNGWSDYFNEMLDQLGEFMIQMGSMIMAYGIAMEAFKDAFSNPYVAIAAGAALVVLGGMITGLAASGTTSSSSSSSYSSSSGSSSTSSISINNDVYKDFTDAAGNSPFASEGDYINAQTIEVTGDLRVKGKDLVAAIENNNRANSGS